MKKFKIVNLYTFGLGVGWCVFLYILAALDIGKTLGPSVFTFWDAVLVPFVGAVFPFLLGVMSFYRQN